MKKLPLKTHDMQSLKYMLLSAVSGVLTALSQTTQSWYLAFFCIVPLYFCIFYQNVKNAIKCLFLSMTVYHGIMCSFLLTLYDYLDLPFLLMLAICIIVVAAIALLQSAIMLAAVYPSIKTPFRSRAAKIVAFSACFSLGQFFMEIVPYLSFPWAKLENALSFQPVLLQSAALFGGGFTAFLLLLLNGLTACLFEALYRENVKRTLAISAVAAVGLSLVTVCGAWYMLNKTNGQTIPVAAVQGSQEGLKKNSQTTVQAAEEYSALISQIPENSAELVLLPETAFPCELSENVVNMLPNDTPDIVTGCIYESGGKRYNCLAPLRCSDSVHLKQVLVPLGEYTPFFKLSGFTSLTPSKTDDCIFVGGRKYAASICIESIYSSLLSKQISDGGSMILMSTNDSWFKNSFAREVHFRHSILRAVEYDRSLLRSGNCGISALIDRNGFVTAAQYGKQGTFITANAELSNTRTPYSVWGNIFQLPALLFVIRFYVLTAVIKLIKYFENRRGI